MSSTNRGTVRNVADYYSTPHWAIDLICQEIEWSQITTVLEPARGDNRINEHIKHNYQSKAQFDWYEIREGRDYLDVPRTKGTSVFQWEPGVSGWDLVITNPPYSMAQMFVQRALNHGNNVVMLLRLGFLASQARREFWQERTPERLFVLSRRPSFTGKGTDSADYAWFCWGDDFKRVPGIYVL